MRISDWSSDVCSSDLAVGRLYGRTAVRTIEFDLAAGRHIDTAPDRCAELDTAGLAAEIVDGHRGVIAALAGIHRIAGARLEIGLPRLRRRRLHGLTLAHRFDTRMHDDRLRLYLFLVEIDLEIQFGKSLAAPDR